MNQSSVPLYRALKSVKQVHGPTMITYAEALCTGSLLYNMHTQYYLTAGNLDKLTSKLMTLYRACTNTTSKQEGDRWTITPHVETLLAANVLDVKHRITIARLRLMRRVFKHGPDALWLMIDLHVLHKSAFFRRICADFVWLARMSGILTGLPDPFGDLPSWFEFIAADSQEQPSQWLSAISRAAKSQLALSQDERRLQIWHKAAAQCYQSAKQVVPVCFKQPFLNNGCFAMNVVMCVHMREVGTIIG